MKAKTYDNDNYLRKSLELGELAQETEHLHGDGRAYDEQAHCEYDKAPQFFPWTKDFVHKSFQQRRCFYKTYDA